MQLLSDISRPLCTQSREQIYKKICEATILQYKSDTLDIEAMEVDTEGASEND